MKDAPVCPYGHLARACETCELQAEVASLRARLAAAERETCDAHNERTAVAEAEVARLTGELAVAEKRVATLRQCAEDSRALRARMGAQRYENEHRFLARLAGERDAARADLARVTARLALATEFGDGDEVISYLLSEMG